MTDQNCYTNASGLHVVDISMHLPRPLAGAFESVAKGEFTEALNWLSIEAQRRGMVQTQGHDAVMLARPYMLLWTPGEGEFERLRHKAMTAIVEAACNWMLPGILDRARELVTAMLEFSND